MKKTIFIFIFIFVLILLFVYTFYSHMQNELNNVKKFNFEYTQYLNKDLSSTDVATLLNKAMDYNEKSQKHMEAYDNEKSSIRIKLRFKNVKKEYSMESIQKLGIEGFVDSFSNSIFKIVDYSYNNSRINKLVIEEIEIGNI